MGANWGVTKVAYDRLEKTLESAPPGWSVFAVLPYGTSGTEFIVIFRQS